MNIERLRKIIAYSDKNHDEIYSMIKRFCSFAGIEYDSDLLNVLQIVRSSFQKKGFLVLEIPFADDEIGALFYKGDGLWYVVINTSLPKVNTNFAISHEIYHVFWGENEFVSKVEFSDDHYYEHEEEYAANLFAVIPTFFIHLSQSFGVSFTQFITLSHSRVIFRFFCILVLLRTCSSNSQILSYISFSLQFSSTVFRIISRLFKSHHA